MSLVPILFRDWLDDVWDSPLHSSRILDQHFATALLADDLFGAVTTCPRQNYRRHGYYRPWRTVRSQQDMGSFVDINNERFQINLDVQQFTPDEITVTVVDDTVVVEGKHEEKQDEHGYVSRQFMRKYKLPNGHEAEDVTSFISADGVLTVTAPRKPLAEDLSERIVPITQTDELLSDKGSGTDKEEDEK
ncbi:AAEL010654-PA [Aedes aegypti]|uniref:AAEL010654-PA n=1 Tax=Aedes aegypti TaxID=7159 RepID=Q16S83_AEDAE|nr:AAEL010654-PA [Aedes aegypti]